MKKIFFKRIFQETKKCYLTDKNRQKIFFSRSNALCIKEKEGTQYS